MTDTLALLTRQNTREVWLLLDPATDEVTPVRPGTPDAARFVVARVAARDIRNNLLYAALGRDGYVAYATWVNAQAQKVRAAAEASKRKGGDAEPFDDAPPDSAEWRAHSLVLEQAADEAVLEVGLIEPPYAQVHDRLGPYLLALVREIVQWGRTAPAWTPEEPESGNSSSAS